MTSLTQKINGICCTRDNSRYIVSASRREDIPMCRAEWFKERLKEGSVLTANAFGGRFKISLLKENVIGYVFWTKFAPPQFIETAKELHEQGMPVAFHFTIVGYTELEKNIPALDKRIQSINKLAEFLPSGSIAWRYDPVIICDRYPLKWHFERFSLIARSLDPSIKTVFSKIIEPYIKTVRNLKDDSVLWRDPSIRNHEKTIAKYPDLKILGYNESLDLYKTLSEIAKDSGMSLNICASPELVESGSFNSNPCIGDHLFKDINASLPHSKGPSRDGCRCITTLDIGLFKQCKGGCSYCYGR